MDIRTRQGLLNAMVGKVGKRMDNLLIPLELLCCISRAEFSDMKAYLRWQKRQVSIALVSYFLNDLESYPHFITLYPIICVFWGLVKHAGGRPHKPSSCWIWGVRSKSQ